MKAIGIDIGGTKIAIGAVSDSGRVKARVTLPTDSRSGFAAALERIGSAIEEVIAQAGWVNTELTGLGIGCTGPVDPQRGTIHNPHTLPTWDDCDLVSPLRERFGVMTCLESDADAAAVGEWSFGAGRGVESLIMLTLGTGIGFSAVARGRIFRGAGGVHPEPGHLQVDPRGPECYCGTRGCVESLASGSAIDRFGQQAGLGDARAVFAAAKQGHRGAREILDRAVDAIAAAAWNLAHSFAPEQIAIAGGIVDEHGAMFVDAIRNRLASAVMIRGGQTVVTTSQLGANTGVVGAASLVLSSEFPLNRR